MKEQIINSIVMMLAGMGVDTEGVESKLYILLKDVQITQMETALAVRDDAMNERLLRQFLAAKMVKGCTARTIEQYGKELKKILAKFGKPCTDITADDVRLYIAFRMTQDEISKVTANSELRYLRTFFAWMLTEELIAKNPMLKIDAIKENKVKKKAFSDIECEKIRQACSTPMETAIVEVLLSTGCRVSELCQMRIDELQQGHITVHGKGNKDRIVYLTARAEVALQKYLAERSDTNPYIFPPGINSLKSYSANGRRNPAWYLNPALVGEGMRDKSSIEAMARKLGRRANVENVHPHRFRRTSATFALRRGMPIEFVSKMLGHEQLTTTQIYLDLNDDDLEAAHRKYVT